MPLSVQLVQHSCLLAYIEYNGTWMELANLVDLTNRNIAFNVFVALSIDQFKLIAIWDS